MITCAECIDSLKPDDPRVRSGKYHLCGCDYCNKPSYCRDLELKLLEPQEQVIIHRHSNMGKQEYDMLQQTSRQVKHLQTKVDKLIERDSF